jgi:hypothetical protein
MPSDTQFYVEWIKWASDTMTDHVKMLRVNRARMLSDDILKVVAEATAIPAAVNKWKKGLPFSLLKAFDPLRAMRETMRQVRKDEEARG